MLLLPESFPNPSLPSIANHCVADFSAHRQAQTGTRCASASTNHQHIVGREVFIFVDAIKIIAREQTLLFFERQFFGHANGPK